MACPSGYEPPEDVEGINSRRHLDSVLIGSDNSRVENDLTPCFSSTACWIPDRQDGTGMKRSRFTEEQIIGVLRERGAGVSLANVCRMHGMLSATFDAWKSKYGGMEGEAE